VKGSLGLEEIAKPVSIPKKRAQEKKLIMRKNKDEDK
jgi:hypothetical protein